MNFFEIKRVILSRKTLILLGMIVILHSIFFYYQCNDLKANTLTGTDLDRYIENYSDNIQNTLTNADDMITNPLFSNNASFVYRNLIKTKEDFTKLLEITPVAGENRGVTTVMSFQLTGFAMLLVGIYIVMSFLLEQKNGLFLLVRCTMGGRLNLTVTRIVTLISGITVSGIILFSGTITISSFIFSGTDYSRPIQSIPEFGGILLNTSIAGYLAYFLFKKILGCIVVCLVLYLCMSLLRSSLCIVIFILIAIAEYLLYALLLPTDSLCALKYLNLYTVIFKGSDYGHYYNLNLFGIACGTDKTSLILLLAGLVFFAILCVLRYSFFYPKVDHKSIRLFEKISIFISKHKPVLTPTLWEMKKLLLSQKALLILIIVFILAASSAGELSYLDSRSPRLLDWYDIYYGPVDDAKVDTIQSKIDALEKKLARLKKSLERQNELFEEYLMKGYSTDAIGMTISRLEYSIWDHEQNLAALDIIITKARKGLELYKEKGIMINIADTTGYEMLLDNDYLTIRQNYLYVLIAVILMFSGVMACEKASHMETTLHTLYKGRNRLLARKLVLVFIMSCICALSIHLIQFYQINKVLMFSTMEAPIQSVSCMLDFPLKMSIRTYLIAMYAIRALIAFGLSLIVMFISARSKSRVTAIAFGVFFLVIPMVLIQ